MAEGKEGGIRERESIIEKILKEKRGITLQEAHRLQCGFVDYTQEHPETNNHLIRYGSKILLLIIDAAPADIKETAETRVTTFVKNMENCEKKDEETTLLYAAARRLIELECQKTKKRMLYQFSTQDPKMMAWAQTTGKQIFDWDKEEVQTNDTYLPTGVYCEKLFLPPEK